ncbi:MAG: hypothetical protein IJG81_03195, partial [Muribaculaceae bacterium]|nr:hypothetical protein [Muribaculaceae bacterium]
GFIGIFYWLSTLFMWLNLNRFEQIAAVDNLTKLHLSMSKSWLTPDYLFFIKCSRSQVFEQAQLCLA